MIRLLPSIPDTIRLFRATPWPHQKTLVTPRKDMESFLSALLAVFPVDQGVASTDQAVFEPRNVLAVLKAREIALEDHWTFCAVASSAQDVAVLLDAMLNDWIDFVFVPSPSSFAIYADHDEYLTLYVPISSELDRLVARLELAGFDFVADYVRPSGGDDSWR